MGAPELGRLVDRYMRERGWLQEALAYRLSEPERGQFLNETQVRRIRLGQKRVDHHLVERLIEVFELSDAEAVEMWYAAGLWPPTLALEEVQRLHAKATEPTPTPEPEPVVAESAVAAGDQSRTQRKGSPTRQPAPVSAVAA